MKIGTFARSSEADRSEVKYSWFLSSDGRMVVLEEQLMKLDVKQSHYNTGMIAIELRKEARSAGAVLNLYTSTNVLSIKT